MISSTYVLISHPACSVLPRTYQNAHKPSRIISKISGIQDANDPEDVCDGLHCTRPRNDPTIRFLVPYGLKEVCKCSEPKEHSKVTCRSERRTETPQGIWVLEICEV
jgi:hypothetical protein